MRDTRGRTCAGSCLLALICLAPFAAARAAWSAPPISLKEAVVVVRPGDLPSAERAAATVLVEELARRTGFRLRASDAWTEGRTVIAISAAREVPQWDRTLPARPGSDLPELRAEGYRLHVEQRPDEPPIVWVQGADARGALYGVGALLRNLHWEAGDAVLPGDLEIATSPVSPIRGHQLGYRARANSWDAWTADQFDQYIRELVLFGSNSIENIPFEDSRQSQLMKYSRRELNQKMSEICERYDCDYWVWTPADFDLRDEGLREQMLAKHERLYRDCPRLNGVFFPGGDPGDNPPEQVLPFLKELADRLRRVHPDARVWLSLQGFPEDRADQVFRFIETERPSWLGGLVGGPSSPPIPTVRRRLPPAYRLRLYPDITHNKLSQYEVSWWDPAYALTLGREAINPRPAQYQQIHNWYAPLSDGFISYSDGVHDDVNKVVWSMLGWDPTRNPRDILIEYCRLFFGPSVAADAADGILALEKNWQGPLATNGAVEGTLLLWNRLEDRAPELGKNWRWQMNLLRANYDAFIRHRLLYETDLERQANAILEQAPAIGDRSAMDQATNVLNQTVTAPCSPHLHARVESLCRALFDSVGLQTSVSRYQASGAERGAILDFLDYPLNNRWWLEDQFQRIASLPSEAERLAAIDLICGWEDPGEGSYYDDIGNVAKSPHVLRRGISTGGQATIPPDDLPTFWWLDGGNSRARLSSLTTMGWPAAVIYEGLDPQASYTIRQTGVGVSLLRADGERLPPSVHRTAIGEFTQFSVPRETIEDRRLVITWDVPTDEGQLNWRQQSRIAEIWLLKQGESQ